MCRSQVERRQNKIKKKEAVQFSSKEGAAEARLTKVCKPLTSAPLYSVPSQKTESPLLETSISSATTLLLPSFFFLSNYSRWAAGAGAGCPEPAVPDNVCGRTCKDRALAQDTFARLYASNRTRSTTGCGAAEAIGTNTGPALCAERHAARGLSLTWGSSRWPEL